MTKSTQIHCIPKESCNLSSDIETQDWHWLKCVWLWCKTNFAAFVSDQEGKRHFPCSLDFVTRVCMGTCFVIATRVSQASQESCRCVSEYSESVLRAQCSPLTQWSLVSSERHSAFCPLIFGLKSHCCKII